MRALKGSRSPCSLLGECPDRLKPSDQDIRSGRIVTERLIAGLRVSPLERVPTGWNHPIGKNSLQINELEHVLIE